MHFENLKNTFSWNIKKNKVAGNQKTVPLTQVTPNTFTNEVNMTASHDANMEFVNLNAFNLDEILVKNGGIFDPANISRNNFGGNQMEMANNPEKYIDDTRVWRIVNKYFGQGTYGEEDLELLFSKMRSVGCGYVAACNTLMWYALFLDEQDFYDMFGYQMYDLAQDEDGKLYKDYNTELLFLDFFLYYNTHQQGFTSVEEVYGNIEEELEHNQSDSALSNDSFARTGAQGTNIALVGEVFAQFLQEKGINVSFNHPDKVPLEPHSEKWNEKVEELRQMGIEASEDDVLYDTDLTGVIEYFLGNREANQVIFSDSNFTLYYPEDKDGNGLLDDVYATDIGSHAMSIVKVLDDGKWLVSSWGKAFIYDPNQDEPNDCIAYDYFPD